MSNVFHKLFEIFPRPKKKQKFHLILCLPDLLQKRLTFKINFDISLKCSTHNFKRKRNLTEKEFLKRFE